MNWSLYDAQPDLIRAYLFEGACLLLDGCVASSTNLRSDRNLLHFRILFAIEGTQR